MVKWKKYLCIMMSAAMMTTMAAGCGDKKDSTTEASTESKVSVEENTENAAALQEEIEKQVAEGDNSDADKEETVYVMADAEGNVDNVVVSNWLKNNEGTATINDKTNLTDIQNVKTNDTYVENEDGTITWQANGKDVYYQGTSNDKLPVDVKVSYKLDGKDISPAELAGKSGKVTIRFDYTNNTKKAMDVNGTSKEVVTPFVMLSGALLDADKFSNVQVENGKVISEGSRNIVVGYAVPGLKDCLDSGIDDTKIKDVLDDIDVPEYVEITADVTEFELDMTMTVAVSDVLSEAVNLDSDSIDLSDVTDKIDTLTSSADQLTDGTGDLLDGLQTLKEGTYSLRDGAKSVKDGTASLKTYTSQLANGTSQMSAGITQLTDAIGQVQSGAGALNDGAATLASGAKDLNAGVDKLYDGEGILKAGVSQLVAGYEGKDGALAGTDALTAGASQLITGENSLKTGLNTVISGFEDANKGAIAGSKRVAAGAESLKAGINELLGSVTGLSGKLRTKAAGIYGQAGASSAAEVQAMMSSLEADGVIDADELGTYKALSNAYYSGTALESAASEIDNELAGAAEDVEALKKGADDLATGANNLTAGLTKLDDGVKQASDGVDALVSGTTTLKNGTTKRPAASSASRSWTAARICCSSR